MGFRHVALAFGLMPVGACFLATEPADSVDLTVSVDPTTFTVGDTARVVVTIRNDRSYPVEFEAGGCRVHFAIFDSAGREVAPVGLACPLVLRSIALAAGEEAQYRFVWLGEPWTGSAPTSGPPPKEFLPAGRYDVRAVLVLESRRRMSAPVSVRLRPRE